MNSHSSQRWVVYATFDPEGMLRQHAVEQVAAYRDAGSSVLVVDTSLTISTERASAWDHHAAAWFQRENEGYDFGSYKAGLQWIRAHSPDGPYSLLLTNDSCYGPFLPLDPFLQRFDQCDGPPTVFGITDSYELGYHLQSYFLYFQPRTIPLLLDFLRNMKIRDRQDAIENGEIALSRYLLERGVKLKALSPVCELIDRLSLFRWLLLGELATRALVKRYKYNWNIDRQYIKSLIRPRSGPPRFNQTLIAGAELFRLQLSPFVKRQFIRDGFFFRYGFEYSTPATLTNGQVRAMLTPKTWLQHGR